MEAALKPSMKKTVDDEHEEVDKQEVWAGG